VAKWIIAKLKQYHYNRYTQQKNQPNLT